LNSNQLEIAAKNKKKRAETKPQGEKMYKFRQRDKKPKEMQFN